MLAKGLSPTRAFQTPPPLVVERLAGSLEAHSVMQAKAGIQPITIMQASGSRLSSPKGRLPGYAPGGTTID
jgi:hypothetical protein